MTRTTPEQDGEEDDRPAEQRYYDLIHEIESRREICKNCFGWRTNGRVAPNDSQFFKRAEGRSERFRFDSGSDYMCLECGAGTGKQGLTLDRSWNDGGSPLSMKAFVSTLNGLLARIEECGYGLDRDSAFDAGRELKSDPVWSGRDMDCFAVALAAGVRDVEQPIDLDVPFAPVSLRTHTGDDSPSEVVADD